MGKIEKYNYGVVLDAGSSGTRIYVYKWLKNEIARQDDERLLKTLPSLGTDSKWTKKVHPGVSTYGETPGLVGPDHLKKLLDHALSIVPPSAVQDTPIFLLATAGMRLLPDHQRNALVDSICSYIKTETTFLLSDCDLHVQVISGETEGLYGWIAANYLIGGFNEDHDHDHDHGKDHHTYGFLDMGGASAQIAFAPNSTEAAKHANDLKLVRFRNIDGTIQEYRVFVATWLGFGVHEARRRYLEVLLDAYDSDELLDPCLPPGFTTTVKPHDIVPTIDTFAPEKVVVGTGLFNECLKRTYPLLEKDVPCLDEPCLIHGQHVPAIDFDVNHFIGISEYWHTTHEIFEMAHKDKSYDFQTYQSRVKEFCERPWSETQQEVAEKVYGKKVDEKTAYEVCFKASWLINILHDGIGIPRVGVESTPTTGQNGTKEVLESGKKKGYIDAFQAVNKIKSTEVSWTMGKIALYASAEIPSAGFIDGEAYPVGFGSNIPGDPIPYDFQYPGGGRLQAAPEANFPDEPALPPPSLSPHEPPSDSQSLTDKISAPFLNSDSSHRVPGFLLFLVIVIIAIFYLCGRDRRTRFFARHVSRPSHSPSFSNLSKRAHSSMSQSGLSRFVNRIVPATFAFRRLADPRSSSSFERDRTLEEGSSTTTRLYDPADFELGDMASDSYSDSDSVALSSDHHHHYHHGASQRSGYDVPTVQRSRAPHPKIIDEGVTGPPSAGGRHHGTHLNPDTIDRRGLVMRTESREHLPLGGGRKSRNASASPSRLRSVE